MVCFSVKNTGLLKKCYELKRNNCYLFQNHKNRKQIHTYLCLIVLLCVLNVKVIGREDNVAYIDKTFIGASLFLWNWNLGRNMPEFLKIMHSFKNGQYNRILTLTQSSALFTIAYKTIITCALVSTLSVLALGVDVTHVGIALILICSGSNMNNLMLRLR